MLSQEKDIESQIKLLDNKIMREQSQYDEYYKQYEFYEGKTLPPKEFEKAQRANDKLNAQAEKVNGLIDQQNELIVQINDILSQLGCNPNFEIVS